MDSRKDLTKRLIADSFKAMLLRYPFEKISIMMITNEAGIRRPSFYNHFQDKYDLLAWIGETDVIGGAAAPRRRGRRAAHDFFRAYGRQGLLPQGVRRYGTKWL